MNTKFVLRLQKNNTFGAKNKVIFENNQKSFFVAAVKKYLSYNFDMWELFDTHFFQKKNNQARCYQIFRNLLILTALRSNFTNFGFILRGFTIFMIKKRYEKMLIKEFPDRKIV